MQPFALFYRSISGENKHYDTPTNPVAPARVPGGSCSGAAVAVAANLVDFSLGELAILNPDLYFRLCSTCYLLIHKLNYLLIPQ